MRLANNLSLTGGLLVLCVAGYYWGGLSKKPVAVSDSSHIPDYQVTHITGIQVNEQGVLQQKISAATLSHYTQQDQSIVEQPVVTLYQEAQATWQLSAQQATILKNNHHLHLQQNVLAKRLNSTPLQLSTQSLIADQQTHILQSLSPVLVSTAQGQISSLSLEAHTQEGTLQFNGQVRGTYVVSPH